MGGRACIRGHRICASLVVNLVANGMSCSEILAEYPDQASRYLAVHPGAPHNHTKCSLEALPSTAMRAGVADAILEHKRRGLPIAEWSFEEDRVVWTPADQIPDPRVKKKRARRPGTHKRS